MLASCYTNCLDDELSCLFISTWSLTYYMTVLLELETIDRRVKLLKRTMKSETRPVFILFLPQTELLPLNSAGE